MKNTLSFGFKDFGYLKDGELDLANLTIICGKNNTGKTYINYGIYGFLNSIKENFDLVSQTEIEELFSKGFLNLELTKYKESIKENLSINSKKYSKNLSSIFATDSDFFKKTVIEFNVKNLEFDYKTKNESEANLGNKLIVKLKKIENSSIVEIILLGNNVNNIPRNILKIILDKLLAECILESILPRPYVITSERTGVVLFYKELDFTKNRMLDYISKNKKQKFNPIEFLEDFKAKYPISVQQNIDWVRNMYDITKNKSYLWKNEDIKMNLNKTLKKIINGSIKTTKDDLFYVFNNNKTKTLIPIHAASSSIKSLVLLDSYIKNIAKEGDLLIIDEPELNLHPDLQVLMAHLIVKLINNKIKILITTHSDYIIKEFNNLIMLNEISKKDSSVIQSLKNSDDEKLNKDDLKVYLNKDNKITPIEIDEYGINFKELDNFILNQNNKANKLFNKLEE